LIELKDLTGAGLQDSALFDLLAGWFVYPNESQIPLEDADGKDEGT
jgi:hypothetical protein